MANEEMMVRPTAEGWLQVKLDSGAIVPLPDYCHVTRKSITGGRDQITIAEGVYAGKPASVTTGYLLPKAHLPGGDITFFIRSDVMTWTGGPPVSMAGHGLVTGGIPAFTDPGNPVPGGSWNIEIPDFPHRELGAQYVPSAAHAISWFRIATPRATDRYLHPGTASLGCATVGNRGDKTSPQGKAAISNFETLYKYLIQRRVSPGVVAKMKVMDF